MNHEEGVLIKLAVRTAANSKYRWPEGLPKEKLPDLIRFSDIA